MHEFFACARARAKDFKKDELIIEAGMATDEFGILLKGGARSIKWDASGKLTIITLIEEGGAIGVLLAASEGRVSPLSVQATADSTVLFFSFRRILTRCEKQCPHHEKILRRYITLLAEKGLELHERVNCLLEPTVRQKVLTFLRTIAAEQNSREIILPINRNIMAEYLNIERSALSRELSRMKRDGVIDFCKNAFKLL